MRGKRDFENGPYEDDNDQVLLFILDFKSNIIIFSFPLEIRSVYFTCFCFEEELNFLSELIKRGGRGPGAGFVGMRG